jgi:uncharacterized protein YggE
MKKFIFIFITVFLLSIVGYSQNTSSNENISPTIVVNGEAVVNVIPDKITFILGIETSDMDIQVARQKNNDILKKTVDTVSRMGVKKSDIQTDHLSINPRYKSEYNEKIFLGYFVRNTVSIVLKDTKKVEDIITGVLLAGITHIHSINFETTEFKMYREKARSLALEAAKEKAEKMSEVLGKRIGDPVHIQELHQYRPRYYGGWWGYGRQGGMSQNVLQNIGDDSGEISDTIALGKIGIRGSVTVTFELQ